jgi:hypothetical protein
MDEPILREGARAVIFDGKLPSRTPDRTPGARCSVCGLPVTKDEKEFEIELAHDGDNPTIDSSPFTSAASPPGSSSDAMPSVEPQVAPILTEWQRLVAASRDAIIRSRSHCAATEARIEDSRARVARSNRRMDSAQRVLTRSHWNGTNEP